MRGIVILYLTKLRELRGISFTYIYRRIRKLAPEIDSYNSGVLAAIDSSEFKLTLRGDYLGDKWHKKRGMGETPCCYKNKEF